jgi:hypothetical protein
LDRGLAYMKKSYPRNETVYRSLIYVSLIILLFLAEQPPMGQGLLIHEVFRSHKMMHHSRYESSGRRISSSQRPLPDNTQHSQQKDIHAPGGIRTHNLSRPAAADLSFRPRGHWDRHSLIDSFKYCGFQNSGICRTHMKLHRTKIRKYEVHFMLLIIC